MKLRPLLLALAVTAAIAGCSKPATDTAATGKPAATQNAQAKADSSTSFTPTSGRRT